MGRRHPGGVRAGATRRLSLTGTPFRSDTTPIPFVALRAGRRTASCGRRRDYTYGYAAALRDGVVRPVLFLAYGGAMRWRTKAGDEVAARLGEPLTKDQTAQAWRTALDPKGDWVPSVLAAADTRLSEVRRHVPDAGGLVIASNQTSARAYARILRGITGEDPTVVLSDDAGRQAGIEASRPTPRGGWWRCGWCPRASTCRGCASACTPPRPRPRCSSRRRSAGSCGPDGAGRRPRCSCPPCR